MRRPRASSWRDWIAGLPHITWRLLRHWGTTQMVENQVPLKAGQQRLGHSRPGILLRHYAHVLEASAEFAPERLSSQLRAKLRKSRLPPRKARKRRFQRQLAAKRQPTRSAGCN